jgi:LysR family transcriptional regulator, regulator for bpeEF and oprC
MDLNRAAIFAAVVEAQGFTAAARKLRLPKTTVSKRVSDLEAELGIRLLNRTTRSLSLTEAGAKLYAHCRQAIQTMETAEREVQALQSEPEGLLRIGAPSAIGVRFLLPLIADFMAHYPALRISLIAINDDSGLKDDQLDVLIWPGVLQQAMHAVRLVGRVEIGLYASRAYLAAHGTPAVPSALETHKVVAFTQSLSGDRFVWHLRSGGSQIEVVPEFEPRFLSNDAVAIMAATLGGQGIGALPVGYVNGSPEAASLVRLLPQWQAAEIELNAFFRDGRSSSFKTRLFLDFVSGWFRERSV